MLNNLRAAVMRWESCGLLLKRRGLLCLVTRSSLREHQKLMRCPRTATRIQSKKSFVLLLGQVRVRAACYARPERQDSVQVQGCGDTASSTNPWAFPTVFQRFSNLFGGIQSGPQQRPVNFCAGCASTAGSPGSKLKFCLPPKAKIAS
mmetsp:Transcript_40604/g.61350  ORF Transcript_40604/g.61350 Transcript_40604/m.61350 type:complete len:148 (-) Transcript_40604:98-541(-)